MRIFELGENMPDNFHHNAENRDLDINSHYDYEPPPTNGRESLNIFVFINGLVWSRYELNIILVFTDCLLIEPITLFQKRCNK